MASPLSEKHLQKRPRRQRRVSPPIEHARWDRIEYRQRRRRVPTVAKITTVSLPAMSIVDRNPQPRSSNVEMPVN